MALNFSTFHLPEKNVERRVLSNGTVLITAPNPYNQIVAVRIFSRLASRHESGGKAGMANLALRMLSAGTERHNEEEIADLLERNGAHFKAEAGKDFSSIDLLTTTHFLREDLPIVLELIGCPIFPEDKLIRERETVRMNILEQEDSRLTYTMRVFRQHFYGTHPYAWPSIGLIETLDAVQREDLVQFSHAAFDPSQFVVTVIGGSENGDVAQFIEESFISRSPRQNIMVPDSPPASIAVTGDKEVVETRQSEAEYVVLGYPGPSLKESAAVPMRIISALLGGSMDSRLFREIRDKRGLCYQIGSSYIPQHDLTPTIIYVVTSPTNRTEVVTCTEAEIQKLKEEPVSEEELERVKTFVCGSYVMSMETNMGQATRYGTYELAGRGWEYSHRFLDEVAEVTSSDLSEVVEKYCKFRLLTITTPPKENSPNPK